MQYKRKQPCIGHLSYADGKGTTRQPNIIFRKLFDTFTTRGAIGENNVFLILNFQMSNTYQICTFMNSFRLLFHV